MMLLLARVALAADPVLLDAAFDTPSLDGWTIEPGASVGSGPLSTATVEEGALVLRVAAETERFLVVKRTVEVTPGTTVNVAVRMRTEAVDPGPARFDNCDVFVVFEGQRLQALPVLTGTTPWRTLERTFTVPASSRHVDIGAFLSMPGTAWFDDLRVVVVDAPAFTEATSGSFAYRTLPGDRVGPQEQAFNEESVRRVRAMFGAGPEGPIVYYKYPDNATKARLTGQGGNAHTDGSAIHSVWPSDRHEIVHIYARAWGSPPPLLGEGIAVWMSERWQGQPIPASARGVLTRGEWIPLASLLDAAAFRAAPDLVTYAEAGALVAWVAETHGQGALKELYGAVRADADVAANASAFARILGVDLVAADAALRAWVATR